jgi:hypothetical protein
MKVFSSRSQGRTTVRYPQKAKHGVVADSAAKKFQIDRVPTKNYLFGWFAQLRPNADSFLL